MNKNYLVWGGVVVVALLLGYFLIQGQTKPPETMMEKETSQEVTTPSPTTAMTGATESGMMKSENTVSYTDGGFDPKSIKVKVGTTVTWHNMSSKGMWVASAVHPTHNVLPGFDELTSVVKGETYSYTFAKAGNWRYHNHVGPSDTGVVVVE